MIADSSSHRPVNVVVASPAPEGSLCCRGTANGGSPSEAPQGAAGPPEPSRFGCWTGYVLRAFPVEYEVDEASAWQLHRLDEPQQAVDQPSVRAPMERHHEVTAVDGEQQHEHSCGIVDARHAFEARFVGWEGHDATIASEDAVDSQQATAAAREGPTGRHSRTRCSTDRRMISRRSGPLITAPGPALERLVHDCVQFVAAATTA